MRPMTTASLTISPTTVMSVLGAACGGGSLYSARNGADGRDVSPSGEAETDTRGDASGVACDDICDVATPMPSMATNTTPRTTHSSLLLARFFKLRSAPSGSTVFWQG